MFLIDLYKERELPSAEDRIQQTVKVTATTVDIEEGGVRVRLTIVDTPGFGDAVNDTDACVLRRRIVLAGVDRYGCCCCCYCCDRRLLFLS